MQITVGHTPDADDAFMFYALASGKIMSDFTIKHVIQDIETLNKRALAHDLDVTAISAHAFAYLDDYIILKSGGSFGLEYGPIVITRRENELTPVELQKATVAIPGKLTSAALLLKLAIGEFAEREISFESIPQLVAAGEVDAGLVIHEMQIAYDNNKFSKVLDLGTWWSMNAGDHLPLPLGINVASTRSLQLNQITKFSNLFEQSIAYALNNIPDAVEYAMQYSRGQPKETITKFVKMYVNDLTLDMGAKGKQAIEKMFAMAKEKKLVNAEVTFKVL